MKLGNGGMGTVVSSEGVQTTSAFNIARTPHMFNILSSGLYSDKIAAVLREIGCNAMDAHIMGGCPDKAFQVKLPTTLDRSFYVRDWGPGLDDRELRELYTTYGWSSKQNNDDVTGAFGLGSKSPFAYTLQNEDDADGFTVESAKNGRKAIYTCYIDETGAPAISRMHEGPSDPDWPHGVKVTFPVQTRDISEFHEKARDIFRWFKVKPEVLGLNGPLEDVDFKFRGSFFAMQPSDPSAYPDRSPCIIMGNVRYPLNSARIRDLNKAEEALLRANIHLWVPMGTVMMTPSREELEYTERTRRGIKEWLGKAVAEVANRIREDVMTPEATMWAWYKKIQAYYDRLPSGVQWGIEELLKHAGVSADEIANLTKIVKEKTAKVPHWVGDGLAGPAARYQKDAATGQLLRDAGGNPVLDVGFDGRGCRVWMYQAGETRGGATVVRRREIQQGQVRNGSEYTAVHLPFLSDVRVYHADGKQADARVRALVRESADVQVAILVAPCKGTGADYAKQYAEKFTGISGLHGLPLYAVSSLEVPAEVELDKQRRKLAKEQGPRVTFADTEIKYMGLNGNVVDTTLGDLEDSDLFYLCVSKLDYLTRAKFRNHAEDRDYSFDGYYRTEVMSAFKKVAQELELPVTGCILVATEGQARRLKLADQGFKPFLPYMAEQLKRKENWDKLTAGVDRSPRVNLNEMWRADDYGWLGILGHHAFKVTSFWKKFVKQFEDSSVTLEVLDFVSKSHEASSGSNDSVDLLNALSMLCSRFHGAQLSNNTLDRMSHYDVRRQFLEKYPSFDALNEGRLCHWLEHEEEKALTLLGKLLEMDGARYNVASAQPLQLAA